MGEIDSGSTLYKTLANNIFDGLLQVDVSGLIILWNKGAERITGHSTSKMIGQDFREIFTKHLHESGARLSENISLISKTLGDGMEREGLITCKHAGGYIIKLLSHTSPIYDENQRIIGALQVINDNKTLIAAYQQNQKTEETVLLDSGTGIGNRAHIQLKIRHALDDFHTSGVPIGILFVDIDHFKDFNDTYGHLVGDRVLRFVANTLRQNLRTSDSCGRWGGEEFIALVLDSNLEGLKKVAEKLRVLVENGGISEKGVNLGTTISIGATIVREDDTVESLLERADKLMYKSKEAGRNQVTAG